MSPERQTIFEMSSIPNCLTQEVFLDLYPFWLLWLYEKVPFLISKVKEATLRYLAKTCFWFIYDQGPRWTVHRTPNSKNYKTWRTARTAWTVRTANRPNSSFWANSPNSEQAEQFVLIEQSEQLERLFECWWKICVFNIQKILQKIRARSREKLRSNIFFELPCTTLLVSIVSTYRVNTVPVGNIESNFFHFLNIQYNKFFSIFFSGFLLVKALKV